MQSSNLLGLASCLTLALISVARGEESDPEYCCHATAVEGKAILSFGQLVLGKENKGMGEGTVHYDYPNKRAAVFDKVHMYREESGELTQSYVNVYMIQPGPGQPNYIHLPDMKYCMVTDLPLLYDCQASKQNYTSSHRIGGLGGDTMMVDQYDFSLFSKEASIVTKNLVMRDTCFPISMNGVMKLENFVQSFSAIYLNMEEGIKDTSVFDVPEECKNAKTVLMIGSGADKVTINTYLTALISFGLMLMVTSMFQ